MTLHKWDDIRRAAKSRLVGSEFTLDFGITATCRSCRRVIDPDELRGCGDRVLQTSCPDGVEAWLLESSKACPQCGGSRVRIVVTRDGQQTGKPRREPR